MRVDVNGAELWFDVDGPGVEPDAARMRERPIVLLVHGGPGSYDHSYFKPWFAELTPVAQVVYLDLRGHGRSSRHDPAEWSFEACADDVAAFCDVLGLLRPVVLGHSMGGIVAMLAVSRFPGRFAGLVLQSTLARFDLGRLVASFARAAGNDVAELARRSYAEGEVTDAEWAPVFAAFGPHVPSTDELERRIRNPALGLAGMALLRALDVRDQLGSVDCPTLVCVGDRDPVTDVGAAQEIVAGLPPSVARLEVLEGAGHFPWLDAPGRYWPLVRAFIVESARQGPPADCANI
jgi:proline iminopeptidase